MAPGRRRSPMAASAVTALALVVLGGCGSDDATPSATQPADTPTGTSVPPPATTPEPTTDTTPGTTAATGAPTLDTTGTQPTPQHDATPAAGSLYAPGDVDPGLAPWVDEAIADLAGRLDTDPAAITTIAAVPVTWPDSSVGCPVAGMQYLQVMTDGAVIELAVDGSVYRYHSGDGASPFLCDTPLTAVPGAGG